MPSPRLKDRHKLEEQTKFEFVGKAGGFSRFENWKRPSIPSEFLSGILMLDAFEYWN